MRTSRALRLLPVTGALILALLTVLATGVDRSPAVPPSSPSEPSSTDFDPSVTHGTEGPSLGWTPGPAPTGVAPGPRCCGGYAWDPSPGGMLLFGGAGACGNCNDTWEEVNGDWTNLTPSLSASPSGRSFSSMVYDPALEGVLLFGGLLSAPANATPRGLSDTWVFVNGAWRSLAPIESPPARWAAGMVYDPALGGVVLFGGFSVGSGFLADTWLFANGTWTPITGPVAPSARWAPSMAEDPAQDGVLLFGGYSPTQGLLNDTWLLEGRTWVRESSPSSPSPRQKSAMAYDPSTGGIYLFGGEGCAAADCDVSSSLAYENDTWSFSAGTWTNLTSSLPVSPPARCCAFAAYDPAEGRLELLLGSNATAYLPAQAWSFSTPGPSELTFTLLQVVPATVVVGQTATVEVGLSGNQGSIAYAYSALPAGCDSVDAWEVACTPGASGEYTIGVLVRDEAGNATASAVTLDVQPLTTNGTSAPPSYRTLGPPFAEGGFVTALGVASVVAWTWGGRRPSTPSLTPTRTGTPSPAGNASAATDGRAG